MYFPVAENLTKKDFPVTINIKKGRCDKRFGPKWCYWTYHLCQQNRHLAEWRFCFFILIVTVSPKTCNVKIIGIGVTSFRREWPNRLPYDHSALSCPGNRADLFSHRIGELVNFARIPLRGFAGVAPELVLAWAGVLLLAGIPPEKLPASRA